MIDLTGVIDGINARGLKLFRTSGGLRIEGDCPPDLQQAIAAHQASLRMIAKPEPEQQAKETADDIRQQVERYAEAIVKRYLPRLADERLASAVDTQEPAVVEKEIAKLIETADVLEWACGLFPVTMETEAKHAAKAGAKAIGETAPEEDLPF